MSKICNQTFVKDRFRNRKYSGTMKCMCCGEESHLRLKFPILLNYFNNSMKAFVALHTANGCNETAIEAPQWSCKTLDISVIAQNEMW